MPIDKSQLDSKVRAAFARQEKYAAKVGFLYDDYIGQILQMVNAYPIDKTKPFNFKDYPALQRRVDGKLAEMTEKVTSVINSGIDQEWEEANKVSDALVRTAFGPESADDPRFKRYYGRNTEARDAFKKRLDAGGMGLSDRIWQYSGDLKKQMDAALQVGFLSGKSANDLSREVRGFLNEPDRLFRRVRDEQGKLQLSKAAKAFHPGRGVYRSSYKNAMRVTRTETNMAYKAADMARYQQLDFVVGFEVKLSKSHPVRVPEGDICDRLAGKYPKEFEFKSWHPQCLCYVVSIQMTDDEFWKMQDDILDGKKPVIYSENEITDVPDNFKKWIDENRQRINQAQNKPYFYRDNIGFVVNDDPNEFIKLSRSIAPQFDKDIHEIADKLGVKTTPVNIKRNQRIFEKARNDYNGHVKRVRDMVRSTFVSEESKHESIIAEIQKRFNIDPRHLKIQRSETDPMGYSGYLMNFRSKIGTWGKMQVNTPQMIYAKEKPEDAQAILGMDIWKRIQKASNMEGGLGHQYYEEYRKLKPSIPEQELRRAELRKISRAYYAAIRNIKY